MKIDISTTRQEKLKFLNDLKKGKTCLQDFSPVQFGDVWFALSDEIHLENQKTGEIITRAEFEKRYKKENVIKFK